MDEKCRKQIEILKKEKDAVILAHYYVDGEVQEYEKSTEKVLFGIHRQFFPNMKRIRLESVLKALQNPDLEIVLRDEISLKVMAPLRKMLELA